MRGCRVFCRAVVWGAVVVLWTNHVLTRWTEQEVLARLPAVVTEEADVAVVGNGPSIGTRRDGARIDASDVVVRFNGFVRIPEQSGVRTTIHATTAWSPRPHERATTPLVVYNTWLHEYLPVYAHPFAFRVRRRALEVLTGSTDLIGPSSGLSLAVFLAAVRPRCRVTTYGIGEFASRSTTPDELHYFDPGNGSLVERGVWAVEGALGLHHPNETAALRGAERAFANLCGVVESSRPTPVPVGTSNGGHVREAVWWDAVREDGVALVRGAFSPDALAELRAEVRERALRSVGPLSRTMHRLVNPTGVTTVDFLGRSEWYASRDGSYKVARFVETVVRDWVAQQLPSSTPLLFEKQATSPSTTSRVGTRTD